MVNIIFEHKQPVLIGLVLLLVLQLAYQALYHLFDNLVLLIELDIQSTEFFKLLWIIFNLCRAVIHNIWLDVHYIHCLQVRSLRVWWVRVGSRIYLSWFLVCFISHLKLLLLLNRLLLHLLYKLSFTLFRILFKNHDLGLLIGLEAWLPCVQRPGRRELLSIPLTVFVFVYLLINVSILIKLASIWYVLRFYLLFIAMVWMHHGLEGGVLVSALRWISVYLVSWWLVSNINNIWFIYTNASSDIGSWVFFILLHFTCHNVSLFKGSFFISWIALVACH